MSPVNPGSALDQAIGNLFEGKLEEILRKVVEDSGYVYHSGRDPLPGYSGKTLRVRDKNGKFWRIDLAVTDKNAHLIIVGEMKYIQRAKHATDKGSWICNCHTLIRQTFPTIRASIAMLAGGWTENALRMIRNTGTDIFFVPYKEVVNTFSRKGMEIDWTDAESDIASQIAWEAFCDLNEQALEEIKNGMIQKIAKPLKMHVENILNDKKERKIAEIEINIQTNKGEILNIKFSSTEEARSFLKKLQSHPFFSY